MSVLLSNTEYKVIMIIIIRFLRNLIVAVTEVRI